FSSLQVFFPLWKTIEANIAAIGQRDVPLIVEDLLAKAIAQVELVGMTCFPPLALDYRGEAFRIGGRFFNFDCKYLVDTIDCPIPLSSQLQDTPAKKRWRFPQCGWINQSDDRDLLFEAV